MGLCSLMAALAQCFCEKTGQVICFKAINTVVCTKTSVGRLHEHQNHKFLWLRPSNSKTREALQIVGRCMFKYYRSSQPVAVV